MLIDKIVPPSALAEVDESPFVCFLAWIGWILLYI